MEKFFAGLLLQWSIEKYSLDESQGFMHVPNALTYSLSSLYLVPFLHNRKI